MSLQLSNDFSFRAPAPKNLPSPETQKTVFKKSIVNHSREYSSDEYQRDLKTIYENQPTEKLMLIFEAKKQTYNQQKQNLSYYDLQQIRSTRWKNLDELRVLRYVIKKREGVELEIFE